MQLNRELYNVVVKKVVFFGYWFLYYVFLHYLFDGSALGILLSSEIWGSENIMTDSVSLPNKKAIKIFLTGKYGEIGRLKTEKLGAGVHGIGYKVSFNSPYFEERKNLILKTIIPSGFGHDRVSDRVANHLLSQESFSELPDHVECVDVLLYNGTYLRSMKGTRECYLLMEEAKGKDYFRNLKNILQKGSLVRKDRDRAKKLAKYLADIHSKKYLGENGISLYKRKIRDTIGHGECLMGIFDTYESWPFIKRGDMVEIVQLSIPFWDRLKDNSNRLCQVHGDFHPGNIWFDGDKLILLDRSRGMWGEPADDLFCLLLNYIFYALLDSGEFKGAFKELFFEVYDTYLGLSWDMSILKAAPLFLAFRAPVIANPNFYPHVDDTTRKRLITFAKNVLRDKAFDALMVNKYLGL